MVESVCGSNNRYTMMNKIFGNAFLQAQLLRRCSNIDFHLIGIRVDAVVSKIWRIVHVDERKYKVDYSSYDEIKIINNYSRKFPNRILKIRNSN